MHELEALALVTLEHCLFSKSVVFSLQLYFRQSDCYGCPDIFIFIKFSINFVSIEEDKNITKHRS